MDTLDQMALVADRMVGKRLRYKDLVGLNENRLIFGDNLEVMREDVPDESVGNTPNTLAFPIPSHTLRSLPASINSGLRGGLLLWWTVWSRTESRDGMAELTAWTAPDPQGPVH